MGIFDDLWDAGEEYIMESLDRIKGPHVISCPQAVVSFRFKSSAAFFMHAQTLEAQIQEAFAANPDLDLKAIEDGFGIEVLNVQKTKPKQQLFSDGIYVTAEPEPEHKPEQPKETKKPKDENIW